MKLIKDWTFAHLLYYLSIIGYVASGIVIVLLITGFLAGSSASVSIEVEAGTLNQFNQLEKMGIEISNNLAGSLNVSEADYLSGFTAFIFYLGELGTYILAFITTFLFSKISKSVINKEPFSKKNATYFYIIGWTYIVSSIIYILFGLYVNWIFGGLNMLSGIEIIWPFSAEKIPVTLGIIMIVLGYIFKEGNRLVEEQKLTV